MRTVRIYASVHLYLIERWKDNKNPKMNLGGAALNKLKQFCCKFSQYLVSNFKSLKEFAVIKKNQRHACNMNAFVFVLPCKACLLPFTEQRALSWVWSPHSPQTRHFISFLQYKRCLFFVGEIFVARYTRQRQTEGQTTLHHFYQTKDTLFVTKQGPTWFVKETCLKISNTKNLCFIIF